MVHTANCSLIFKSTAQIFVCAWVVTCCSMVAGLLNCFSRGVCNHHCFPRRISEGLPNSTSAGSSLPVIRILIQLQHVPVQTLSMMLDAVRSFHCPARVSLICSTNVAGLVAVRSTCALWLAPSRGESATCRGVNRKKEPNQE